MLETASMTPTVQVLLVKVDELRHKQDAIRHEADRCIAEIEDDITAIQRTITILARQPEAATYSPSPVGAEHSRVLQGVLTPSSNGATTMSITAWASKLHGLRQIDALILIARAYDGRLRAALAKHIFVETGFAKGKKTNVGSHVYHILDTSPSFRKIEPGLYELIDNADSSLPESIRDVDDDESVDDDLTHWIEEPITTDASISA